MPFTANKIDVDTTSSTGNHTKFLSKRLYTRVIIDKGVELLAKDTRGHWRRIRAY